MQRTSTQKRIEALARERKKLQISLNQLKESLSKRHGNLPLPWTEKNYVESRASHSVSEASEIPKLIKKLKISELINRVVYTNDEMNILDDGTTQYIADAVTGSVAFQVQFVVKDKKNEEMIVDSLKVAYPDLFHEAELKTFSKMCMRQNNMQKLIRGVVSYAEVFAKREEITNRLSEESEPHFSVTKQHENEAYNVTAKAEGRRTSHFSCEWKIIWNEGSLTMIPSFTIRAKNETHFYKENEYLFRKLALPGITSEEVTELWQKLEEAVILENMVARH